MTAYNYELMFNLSLVIGHADHRTETCGFADSGKTSTVLRAAFVTWLVACEEARAQIRTNDPKASFVKHVVEFLPDDDHPAWEQTNSEGFHSSLKNRMQGIWGIRIAFTHSDGDVSKIGNLKSKAWAQSAHSHVKGVAMSGNMIDMSGADLHYIHRSFAQLQTVLK
jgi:hypothetical protein